MRLWKWLPGRQQGCAYQKFTLWYFRIGRWGFDAYLLKYPPSTVLPWHTDPVEGRHWRTNIKLRGLSTFMYKRNGVVYFSRDRVNSFRPDIQPHSLQVYQTGCLKLSLGFVIFDKE